MYSDRAQVGLPRAGSPLWLGELLPDDDEAGGLQAATLIEAARRRRLVDSDGKIHFKGLGGDLTIASLLRANGLRRVVQDYDDVKLDLISVGGWTLEQGRLWATQLLQQDPETSGQPTTPLRSAPSRQSRPVIGSRAETCW